VFDGATKKRDFEGINTFDDELISGSRMILLTRRRLALGQRAAEKIDPGEEVGRHRCAASAVSFSVKQNCHWAGGPSTATMKEAQTVGRSKWDPKEIAEQWRLQLEDSK
jgi:hypothetical protein